ncbi:nicotinic acid mononucleotide adenylyltransferase, partial [Mycobacteroides abscessus]|nr:nicotinic acid mononucleotide adenylyltransferase [Mycobacteroides abscessus]
RIRAGQARPIWYLVPDGVVQYVAKHRLYSGNKGNQGGLA